jgi:hypothetical protein
MTYRPAMGTAAGVADDLWTYRAELAARLRATEAELQRVNAALRALGPAEVRTFDLLRDCMAEEREVDARGAFEYLAARGWEPAARDNPLNAVRTALAHLAGRGEIERVSRGIYRAVAEDSFACLT